MLSRNLEIWHLPWRKAKLKTYILILVFLSLSGNVFSEEDSAEPVTTTPTAPTLEATPYPTRTQYDPNEFPPVDGGVGEWHVNLGDGTKVFKDQASADAYVKERGMDQYPVDQEASRIAQAKADAG